MDAVFVQWKLDLADISLAEKFSSLKQACHLDILMKTQGKQKLKLSSKKLNTKKYKNSKIFSKHKKYYRI